MLDLLNIARIEAEGGDLFSLLEGMFAPADVRPSGYPDAVIWRPVSIGLPIRSR